MHAFLTMILLVPLPLLGLVNGWLMAIPKGRPTFPTYCPSIAWEVAALCYIASSSQRSFHFDKSRSVGACSILVPFITLFYFLLYHRLIPKHAPGAHLFVSIRKFDAFNLLVAVFPNHQWFGWFGSTKVKEWCASTWFKHLQLRYTMF